MPKPPSRPASHSIWVPQLPGDFDALTAIALMGRATDRVELGTAVLPIQTRHPVAMAQQALSNQAVCEGRFTLGLGPSHHWIVEDMLGLPYDRPARQVRDYLEVLNAAFAGPGPVDVENDSYRVHNPLDVTDIVPTPVLLAALAPVMLRIAGEHAVGDDPLDGGRAGDRRARAAADHARRRPRPGGRTRGSWPVSRSRCAPTTRSTTRARGPTRCSGTPSTRRTTSGCSSTATPPTSATCSPRATRPPSSTGCAASATRASPTWPSACSRSGSDRDARIESRERVTRLPRVALPRALRRAVTDGIAGPARRHQDPRGRAHPRGPVRRHAAGRPRRRRDQDRADRAATCPARWDRITSASTTCTSRA